MREISQKVKKDVRELIRAQTMKEDEQSQSALELVDEESNDLNFALQNDLDGVYDGVEADKYFYG